MMTLISWVNRIYGLVSCNQRFQLLLQNALRNTWRYVRVIWKSRGILFSLTRGNRVMFVQSKSQVVVHQVVKGTC